MRNTLRSTRPSPWLLLASLALGACGSSSGEGDSADAGSDAPRAAAPELDFSDFDAAVDAFLLENDLPGASAVVVHRDWGIVHESGYGAFAADRVYLIASSSKILTVGVLMRLHDEGVLDVDAPIGDLVSEWGSDKAELTLAQMVSNSSGLVGLVDNPVYAPYICQYLPNGTLEECGRAIYQADDAADRIAPDTEFHYGGGQWQLAGAVAEHASGKSWSTLVRETYVEPCGTPSLGYTNHFAESLAAAGGELASAFDYPSTVDGDPQELGPTDNPNMEGGAYVAAGDYGRILLMHLRDGLCDEERVLAAESVAKMREDRIAREYSGETFNPLLAGYGMGWWIDRDQTGVFVDGGAYGAMPWLDLPRGYGAFLLIESNSGVGSAFRMATKSELDRVFDEAAPDG